MSGVTECAAVGVNLGPLVIFRQAAENCQQNRVEWLAGVDEDANYLFQIPAATPKNPPQQRKRDRDRAERMRLAGGPMPSLREKAYAFARQRTIVRTSDFTAIGIPRHYLAWMCEEGWLVREGYGLYRAAEREAA